MLEVKQPRDLRQEIIKRVIEMKNGNRKCSPQPDAARAELAHFVALLPWLELATGVREALKSQK
jgi:hypothetical protein